jgi:SAM-dependent methyltransferase
VRNDEHGSDASPPTASALRLVLAYQAAHAVYVAMRLGVPELLGDDALTSREIALKTATQPDMMRRLLRALAAFEVVRDRGADQFELTSVGECLRADSRHSVRPLALMYGSDLARQSFACLEDCVTTGKNAFEIGFGVANGFDYFERYPELAGIFDDGMSVVSAFTGPAAAAAYNFDGVRHIVDVGGGQGRVLATILHAHPHLRGTLFDLPRVIAGAPGFLASTQIANRCDVVGGDMFDAVPAGGDLYLLSHVIHNWDDPRATRVLQSCRRAMGTDARLIILDRVMPDRVEPGAVVQGNALMDLMMMVRTGGGRERTAGEFRDLLAAAGLRLERIIPMQISEALVEAKSN